MREIKFRAWDEDGLMYVPHQIWFLEDEVIVWETEDIFGILGSSITTIMQYTGIKDSKDQEIYEDDLVEAYGKIWRVIFSYGSWNILYANQWKYLNNVHCTVVGNWYQNKDLMYSKKG